MSRASFDFSRKIEGDSTLDLAGIALDVAGKNGNYYIHKLSRFFVLYITAILRPFSCSVINNLLLTEREGRTGEYWPKVVTVRTEHREVRTKTTEGQYSPVRLEQARLVSSLLYGTRLILCILLSNALPVS